MREVKLRAFEITNIDLNNAYSDLSKKLFDKLTILGTVDQRRMRLNEDDPANEEDLISNFQQNQSSIFCTMLRIEVGNNIQHITSDLFKKKSFTINDINKIQVNGEAIYKSCYYFSVSDNYLVTNLPGNITIKRLETYLNWLLEKYYQLTPIVDSKEINSLGEIKDIVIQDEQIDKQYPNYNQYSADEKEKNFFSSLNLTKQVLPKLKSLFSDTKNLPDIEFEQIVSVKLLVQFRKPKKDDPKELKKLYGAILKPVSNLENFTFNTRNGKKFKKGQNILLTKTVKIEKTNTGFLNEIQLAQEMDKFILELKNEEIKQ